MIDATTQTDLILYNGTVFQQTAHQSANQAIAISDGRITAVGESDEILLLGNRETKKVNLDGRLVVPGFIDTHIHFYEWAMKRNGVRLDDLASVAMLEKRLRDAARRRPAGEWILGQGWNETDWDEPTMPTRAILDRAAPHHPVLLWRCDLHLAAANSLALRMARIDSSTPDPLGGTIERDTAGKLTGILRELAINKVRDAVAPPKMDQILSAFHDGMEALHRRGITGIHDVRLMADQDGATSFQAFQRLDRNRDLRLRTWVALPGDRLDEIIELGLQTGFGNDRLRVGHVKFFSDGGMGARTAWMIEPFLDSGHGMPAVDMESLAGDIRRAEAAGLSVMVHSIGDRANREVIDLFKTLTSTRSEPVVGGQDIPHRIEHVQMIRTEDVVKLSKLNVALCVNPTNMILDINMIDSAVGEKGVFTYPFRRLMDSGAPVMFSSDCPVCDPDPLLGIHAAVTRQRIDGTPKGGWYSGQRVTVDEAIRAYTATPASVHRAFGLGHLEPGKRADLAVLSDNIVAAPPSSIPEVNVDMTVFDGAVVFRKL